MTANVLVLMDQHPGEDWNRCGAHLAQVLGRTLLLYKRRQEKPEIVLP